MKQFILGLSLGLATVSWAVTPHDDGSVTFEREEIDAIRMQFYSLKSAVDNCTLMVRDLHEENQRMKNQLLKDGRL